MYDIEVEFDETGKYAVFALEDIAEMFFDSLIESVLVNPTFPDELESYEDSYFYGFDKGLYDGFQELDYDDEIPDYLEDLDLDPEIFASGYEDGYAYGQAQIEIALELTQELEALKEMFISKASAANLIKAYQNYFKAFGDEFIANFFSELELGVAQRENSKYTISLDNDIFIDLLENLFIYFVEHFDGLGASLTAGLNSLSEDDLVLLLIDPDDLQNMFDIFGSLFFVPADEDIENVKELIREIFDELRSESGFDFQYTSTFEKTGAVSFESESTISIKSVDEFLTLDLEIESTFAVNSSEKGKNKVNLKSALIKPNGATIYLTNENEDVLEAGIIYSTTSDFAESVKVAGVSNNNSDYLVEVQGLASNTTYYFKTYYIDGGHNIIYSDEVRTFHTEVMPPSPDTGYVSNNILLIVVAAASLIVMLSLKNRKTA